MAMAHKSTKRYIFDSDPFITLVSIDLLNLCIFDLKVEEALTFIQYTYKYVHAEKGKKMKKKST